MHTVKTTAKECVILIHGMSRTRVSMMLMSRYLKRKGYLTVYYSYSSTKYNISSLAAEFADFIRDFSNRHPETLIHIVSHSLGGILIRKALYELNTEQASDKPINLGRIVMMAPPNRGSKAANCFCKVWPVPNILRPLRELRNSSDSPINKIHVPQDIEIGVIAGRFDLKVTPHESHLSSEKDHLVVNSAHTFIMNNPKLRKAVVNFLQTGFFRKTKS